MHQQILEIAVEQEVEPGLHFVGSLHIGLKGIKPTGCIFCIHRFILCLPIFHGLICIILTILRWLDLFVEQHQRIRNPLIFNRVSLAVWPFRFFLYCSTKAFLFDQRWIERRNILIIKSVPLVFTCILTRCSIPDEAVIVSPLRNSCMN